LTAGWGPRCRGAQTGLRIFIKRKWLNLW